MMGSDSCQAWLSRPLGKSGRATSRDEIVARVSDLVWGVGWGWWALSPKALRPP